MIRWATCRRSSNYDRLPGDLELGAFSISLNVADLEVSEAFYRKLGFERTGGEGGRRKAFPVGDGSRPILAAMRTITMEFCRT
jgi:catechol-2,3-dioxygenase